MSLIAGRVKGVNRRFLLTGFVGGCGGQESGGSLATLEGVLPDSSRLSGYIRGASTLYRVWLTGSASRVDDFTPLACPCCSWGRAGVPGGVSAAPTGSAAPSLLISNLHI
jgi:hypothetical protein